MGGEPIPVGILARLAVLDAALDALEQQLESLRPSPHVPIRTDMRFGVRRECDRWPR